MQLASMTRFAGRLHVILIAYILISDIAISLLKFLLLIMQTAIAISMQALER